MAQESGFFTSVGGDRKYTALFFNERLHEAMQRADGVLAHVDGGFEVTTLGGPSVTVAPGAALKHGIYYRSTCALSLPIEDPTAGKKRYDRIAVRIDRTRRTIGVAVIKGTEGTDPTPPEYDAENDVALNKVLVDRSAGPIVLTLTDEREFRPLFITDRHSIDDLAEGQTYGRVRKEKAQALNAGHLGISIRPFTYAGKTWQEESSLFCALALQGGATILAGSGRTNKISKSKDSGLTWADISGVGADTKVCCLAYTGSAVLAGAGSGGKIYRSLDNGATWTNVADFTDDEYMDAIAVIDSLNAVAAGRNSGRIYASTNGGASWSLKGTIAGEIGMTALESVGGTVLLAGSMDSGKLWRSTNSGATWTMVKNTGCAGAKAAFIKHVGNGLVFAGFEEEEGKLFRSTDYGLSWDAGIQLDEQPTYSCLLADSGTLYLGTGGSPKIYTSEDDGATWTLRYTLQAGGTLRMLYKATSGAILCATKNGHVYWGCAIGV